MVFGRKPDAKSVTAPAVGSTAYDAKYFGIKMPPEVTMTLQERAYASLIWSTPGK